MKKFIIIVASVLLAVLLGNYLYFHVGVYIPLLQLSEIEVNATAEGKEILLKDENGDFVPFEIRGVDLGSGYPGEWSTDFAIDKETYIRWFELMQEMGVNTVRIYTIQSQPFYEAFYEYNSGREEPLYLLHGVWVNDYVVNSYRDAYHEDFYGTFLEDCKIMVDIIHGNRKVSLGRMASAGHGSYLKDISHWVIGYILGVEWDELTVAYLEDADAVKLYLSELDGVFISLTVTYSGKGRIEAAYFPYIVKKYRLIANRAFPSITGILLSLLDEPGIYCRENVMQALYTTGDSGCVIEALKRIDRSGLFYHGKLITDGLLNFMGSIKELSDLIISEFDSFSAEMRVVLLNFIRFSSPDYCEYVFTILQDESEDDELRYSAIRYFAKYRYDVAYATLCRLSSVRDSDKWQYAAIASSALATYPGDTTVELLKHNLTCGNWYVRYNSADSLEKLGITYPELADVLDGEDRFAAEILQYKLKKGELERKEVTV